MKNANNNKKIRTFRSIIEVEKYNFPRRYEKRFTKKIKSDEDKLIKKSFKL